MKKISHIRRRLPVVGPAIRRKTDLATDIGVLQLEKGELEAKVRELEQVAFNPRNFLAHQYLRGNGIEIGAALHPIKLPSNAHVKYVDIFTTEDLRRVFPEEYKNADMVEVDVVDDGETLTKFTPESLDFIIANHFIEHCLDPIGTIHTMYKKLRRQGIIYMAVPDKRYTFDKKRPITTYEHLLEEHADKTKTKFRLEHTEEAVRLGDTVKRTEAGRKARVKELMESDFRIHYHVWTQREITEMFVRLAQDLDIDLEIEALLKNQHEVIYVLRKSPPKALLNT